MFLDRFSGKCKIIPVGYDEIQARTVLGFTCITKTRTLLNSSLEAGETRSWTVAINFYDKYGRLIQTWSQNHINGIELLSSDYDFSGKVLRSLQEHSAFVNSPNQDNHTIATRLEYDNANNLYRKWQTVDNATEVLINTNQYNTIGQLKTKYQHWTTQKIDYLYNIRGWLTKMNDPNNLGFDLFAMQLYYNEGLSALNGKALFNGNISAMVWANMQTTGTSMKAGYGFNYDGANRLLNANYGEGSSLSSNRNAYNNKLYLRCQW
jgi:hypothetical protein